MSRLKKKETADVLDFGHTVKRSSTGGWTSRRRNSSSVCDKKSAGRHLSSRRQRKIIKRPSNVVFHRKEFENQMREAEDIMNEDHDILQDLSNR